MAIFWIILLIIILAIVALKLFSLLFSITGKILIVVLVVFLIYAIAVNASRDLVYKGYIFSDQSITLDNKAFIISFDESRHPSNIQLNYYGSYFFVPQGTCKTIVNIEICFANSIFDTDFGKYKVNISAYRVVPDITITRVIDDSTIAVGDEAEITVNVTNGIGIPAQNFEYIDYFSPEEFELLHVTGSCNKEGNNAVYRGLLKENNKISCKYTIKALKEIERSSRARVSYFDGDEIKRDFSSNINFKVVPALDISSYFNDSDRNVFVGEQVIFIVNMSNNKESDDIKNITLNISLPSGLRYDETASISMYFNSTSNITVQSQPVKKISDSVIQFKGEIPSNQSKFIALKLTATKSGISNIFIDYLYSIEGSKEIFSAEKKDSLEVEHKEITLFTNFKDGDTFDAGEQKLIQIGVSNPNENVFLKNISVKIDTNISNIPEANLSYLDSGKANYMIYQNIAMPYVSSDTTYPFNIIVSYDTEYGEHFTEISEFNLIVKTIAGLSISHDISKTTVESGEQFSIKTKVKNERNVDIKNIRVFDVVPMEFEREGLNSVSNLNINANDEVVAYNYRMTAPVVDSPKTYYFRTTATYKEGNKTFAFERTYQVTVTPKKKDLSVARVIADSKPSRGAIIDVIYTISNPDDKETVENIRLKFPVQQDIDLVGEKNFTISRLLPGESYTIREFHRVRPKLNGSLVIAPTMFSYNDDEGNVFTKNSSETSFTADYGYISGPAFFIQKSSNDSVLVGDLISVIISVSNIGDEPGKVSITDSGNVWNLELKAGETDFITYKINAENEGIVFLKPAEAQYSYRGKNVFTISNPAYTNVTSKKEISAEKEIKEVKVEKVVPTKVEEKKTFMQLVWEAISSIFNIFRR